MAFPLKISSTASNNNSFPLASLTSWGLPFRIIQWIFAILVLGLSANTLEHAQEWREVRFTVAASAWAVLSIGWIFTAGLAHRPFSHHWILVFTEFINWALFLALWVAISVNLGRDDFCRADRRSYIGSRACNTLFSALAFAVADWILFTVSFARVGLSVLNGLNTSEPTTEKNSTAGITGPIRSSGDETLNGEQQV